jgi:hypothetical protein
MATLQWLLHANGCLCVALPRDSTLKVVLSRGRRCLGGHEDLLDWALAYECPEVERLSLTWRYHGSKYGTPHGRGPAVMQ